MKRKPLFGMVRSPSLWLGAGLGCVATTLAFELPSVNWLPVAPPVDVRPMMIRQDAKGDGRFLASRSGGRRHRGIDLVAALNSPVRAIRGGTVVQVGVHRGLGRFGELEHPHGLRSLYAHLNEVSVEAGARVRQGAIIGTVGKTGNARSPFITPHVHVEVMKDGELINPQSLGLQVVEPPPRTAEQERLAGSDGEEEGDADSRGDE